MQFRHVYFEMLSGALCAFRIGVATGFEKSVRS